MNKILMWVLVAAVVVIGGAFAIFHPTAPSVTMDDQNKGINQPVVSSTPVQPEQSATTNGKKIPFVELLKQGGSFECEVAQHIGNTDSNGTVFINGSLLSGEFSTKVSGMNIDSHFIVKDGYSYGWSSMLPKSGYKVKVTQTAGDLSANAQGGYSFNASQIGDYNCKPWTADDSKFTLPAGVTFKDVTAK